MVFTWFKLFNVADFEDADLVSREYTIVLQGIGSKTFLVTKGDSLSITFNDVFLTLNLNDRNPFIFEGLAVFVNEVDDVFVGIELDES